MIQDLLTFHITQRSLDCSLATTTKAVIKIGKGVIPIIMTADIYGAFRGEV